MKLCTQGVKSAFAVGLATLGMSTILAISVSPAFVSRTSVGVDIAHAQGQRATGEITRVVPEIPTITIATDDTVILSVLLYGVRDVPDDSLGSDVIFNWSASGGDLPPDTEGNTWVFYTAPSYPVTQTVTATATSNCASDCTVTFTIRVRRIPHDLFVRQQIHNPPGDIPSILTDANGQQYQVFTPVRGGMFWGGTFIVLAGMGTVPNGEFVGVRMAEDGDASNAQASHRLYTLSGKQYTISIVDAAGAPISSYNFNGTVGVCIPLPEELRTNISNLVVVTKNNDGTLTALSSSVRTNHSPFICGSTSTLPVTISVGVSGTPTLPTPTPMAVPELPPTGGANPLSPYVVAFLLPIGIALLTVVHITTRRLN